MTLERKSGHYKGEALQHNNIFTNYNKPIYRAIPDKPVFQDSLLKSKSSIVLALATQLSSHQYILQSGVYADNF